GVAAHLAAEFFGYPCLEVVHREPTVGRSVADGEAGDGHGQTGERPGGELLTVTTDDAVEVHRCVARRSQREVHGRTAELLRVATVRGGDVVVVGGAGDGDLLGHRRTVRQRRCTAETGVSVAVDRRVGARSPLAGPGAPAA